MLHDLVGAEKPIATIVAFIATYLIALAVGRFLKRRAAVPFGILYQLFCLALAFYVAVLVYGVQLRWRGHVGAAVVLLSTGVLVALIDRYL